MKPVFPSRVMGSPFKVDYANREQVIAYAKRLGSGQVVYKHPDRPNYNITHAGRTELYRSEWVVWRT